MKIYYGTHGQIQVSPALMGTSFQKIGDCQIIIESEGDLSPWVIIKAYHEKRSLILLESKNQLFTDGNSIIPPNGLVLSTSGSTGGRKWIFHPWTNLTHRLKKCSLPFYSCGIFLSLAHAAGIESMFRHYLNEVDFGVYAPSSSPADALKMLDHQKAQAISTTPSVLLRFLLYPPLKLWLKENLKVMSLGGEEISENLLAILEKDFSHVQIQSVLGTTETWSIQTKKGRNHQWHIAIDPDVAIDTSNNELSIETPFLFTHYWDGMQFIRQSLNCWKSGDQLLLGEPGEFRVLRCKYLKYHGLKVFPHEWENDLKTSYQLPWVQMREKWNANGAVESFVGILPEMARAHLAAIKKDAKEKAWPVLSWLFQEAPDYTLRGKMDTSPKRIITGLELKSLLVPKLKSKPTFQFLEPFTWEDAALFSLIETSDSLLFYKENSFRKVVQYMANNQADLLAGLSKITESVHIKWPTTAELNLKNWNKLGVYHSWTLDFSSWHLPLGTEAQWAGYYSSLGQEFDYLLSGPEKIMLSTLADSMGFFGRRGKEEGICAFKLIDDAYFGMYMANRGLPISSFLQICTQSLRLAKKEGCKIAKTVVDEKNLGAEFIHRTLGFHKSNESYSIWTNKTP